MAKAACGISEPSIQEHEPIAMDPCMHCMRMMRMHEGMRKQLLYVRFKSKLHT
jgi:hypothetical protein